MEAHNLGNIDATRSRFPFCIVWTPIPILTYIFPFIGHMGIAMSSGVIRDFAANYYILEDSMAFGKPTKYWQLQPSKAKGGTEGWDSSIIEATEVYKTRMHNLFCDNCHSYVATALNFMEYEGSSKWNMVKIALLITWNAKYVSFLAYIKTWLPFLCFITIFICFLLYRHKVL